MSAETFHTAETVEAKKVSVKEALHNGVEKRKNGLAEGARGLGITSAIIGFMSAVAGRIGEFAQGVSPVTNADYANALNGGLIAMAAGAGIWGAGKLIERRQKAKAQK